MVLGFLLALREGLDWEVKIDDEDLLKLFKDRIISRDYIKGKFILLVPFYEKDQGQEIDITLAPINTIAQRIDEYRILFKGVRVGNMGNKKTCIDLMNKFMIENSDITFDNILEATMYYIQNTDYQYIMNAENFIYKVNDEGRYISKLETVIEEYFLSNLDERLL